MNILTAQLQAAYMERIISLKFARRVKSLSPQNILFLKFYKGLMGILEDVIGAQMVEQFYSNKAEL